MRAPDATLRTRRLLLRSWSPDDAPALLPVLEASRPELTRWTPWVLDGAESLVSLRGVLERFADAFATSVAWRYAMFLAESPHTLVGGCGLFPRVGPHAVEIGYWLATSATGRGYATEATERLGVVAFGDASIECLEIRCDPANDASMRVPERLGYRPRLGVVRAPPRDGHPGSDIVIWERCRADEP